MSPPAADETAEKQRCPSRFVGTLLGVPLAALPLLGSTTGCASGPPRPPVPARAPCAPAPVLDPTPASTEAWTDSTASSDAPRVQLLDEPLTLETALALALANNPELEAGAWDVEAAAARERGASSERWPTLGLAAAYRHHWNEERLVPARDPSAGAIFSKDIFYGDLILRYPLITGGRVVSAASAAELLTLAARKRLARTREELVFNVQSAFYALLGQAGMIAAIEESKQALGEHLRVTEELIATRKAANVDRLNLEVRLAELDHRLVEQQGEVELCRRLLASLLGVEPPAGGLEVEGELTGWNGALEEEALVAVAMENRTDLAELQLEIEAQAERLQEARAGHWPVLSVVGTYGARQDFEGDSDDVGFVGLELSFPAFTGGRIDSRIEEERARLRGLQARQSRLVLDIQREIASAVIEVRTARSRVAATEKAIAMAEESLRIARSRVALGQGTLLEVLEAQSALLDARTTFNRARSDLQIAAAFLDFAKGGS